MTHEAVRMKPINPSITIQHYPLTKKGARNKYYLVKCRLVPCDEAPSGVYPACIGPFNERGRRPGYEGGQFVGGYQEPDPPFADKRLASAIVRPACQEPEQLGHFGDLFLQIVDFVS
jgi:hypothetical protein